MPFVKANGIELYYQIEGQGPRLLFMGGTAGDLRLHPGPLDWPLGESFEVLAYDQRGQGQSGKPDEPYSMAQYAADAAALLDALGWGPFLGVGYSFGGMVAQELALRHPGRLTRLVLCSTTAGGQGGSSYPLHEVFSLPIKERVERMLSLGDLRHDQAWRKEHPDQWQQLLETTTARMRLASRDAPAARGLARQLEARRHHDTFDRLATLELPVLVCGGRYDGVAPPKAQEAMAAAIPRARFMLFEGGHPFFLADPNAFKEIAGFLSEAPAQPAS